MKPVKVAAVQAAPVLLDRDATISKVVALAEQAAAEGARIVAFPEAFVPGYPDWVWRTRPWDADATALYARLFDQAVVVGSAATDVLAETARRLGIWLSVGVDERDDQDSTIYNSLLHFAPDGSLAGRHRKLMPTGGERLVWGMGDGSTLKVIDTAFGRLGGLICWENYMPLARAALYAQGIDVYLAPTWDNSDVWVPTLQHIGKEGRTYVIGTRQQNAPRSSRHRTHPRRHRPQEEFTSRMEAQMKTASPQNAPARNRGADAGVLVEPGWLEAHLHDPAVRVVEVDVSRVGYDQWHIDGAVLWDVYRDLKDGAYRLADTAALERLLARSGIGPDSTVVCYGYAPAMGFWLMKLYGHADVRILNCSRDAWRGEGRPWSDSVTEPASVSYVLGEENQQLRADHRAVQNAIGDPDKTIVDVRSAAEYSGERFWPSGGLEPGGRPGHVPAAVHQPIEDLYDERGAFRNAADLRGAFAAINLDGADELISYCTIGGRACTAWFVLTYLLGRDHVRVYDGSWAEWGRMTGTPVEHA